MLTVGSWLERGAPCCEGPLHLQLVTGYLSVHLEEVTSRLSRVSDGACVLGSWREYRIICDVPPKLTQVIEADFGLRHSGEGAPSGGILIEVRRNPKRDPVIRNCMQLLLNTTQFLLRVGGKAEIKQDRAEASEPADRPCRVDFLK